MIYGTTCLALWALRGYFQALGCGVALIIRDVLYVKKWQYQNLMNDFLDGTHRPAFLWAIMFCLSVFYLRFYQDKRILQGALFFGMTLGGFALWVTLRACCPWNLGPLDKADPDFIDKIVL